MGIDQRPRHLLGLPCCPGPNVEGAFQHVLADLIGSVGVVIAGIIILTIGWTPIDPILSIVIGLLIMRSS